MFELKPRFEYVPKLCAALKACGRPSDEIRINIDVLLGKLEQAINVGGAGALKRSVFIDAVDAIQEYISDTGGVLLHCHDKISEVRGLLG